MAVAGGIKEPLSEYALIPNETSYRLGREAVRLAGAQVDGLYLPCAKWPTVENIDVWRGTLTCPCDKHPGHVVVLLENAGNTRPDPGVREALWN